MRLARLGPLGHERPAVIVPGGVIDVSDIVPDVDGSLLESGLDSLAAVVARRVAGGRTRPMPPVRIGSPIARPHQIIGVGLNYQDHALETGQGVPREPIIFSKSPNTMVGPFDDIHIPRGGSSTDWEIELGVVIGRRSRYLADERAALAAIAGYVIVNDVSERDFQLERGGQWIKGKSAETFNPCGPWLVTPDEVPDPLDLRLILKVNGEVRQSSSTGMMVFTPAYLVHYLSQFMVMEPGDLINTGTPPGVGMGQDPPTFLQPGDAIELMIEGLGHQRQLVRSAP